MLAIMQVYHEISSYAGHGKVYYGHQIIHVFVLK